LPLTSRRSSDLYPKHYKRSLVLDQYLQLALSLKSVKLNASKKKRKLLSTLSCIGENTNRDVLQQMRHPYRVVVISISDTTLPMSPTRLEGRSLNTVIITLKSTKRYLSINIKEPSS